MCGIAGIIDFKGRPVDRQLLETLRRSLNHRGPDDAGIWLCDGAGVSAGFAHTRLAIIDPTPDARQPMIDPTGRFVLTYNGELYNYRQIRDELTVIHQTESDTEVVLNACIQWGTDALKRFDAMWAMAFLDTRTGTGHLSRDPFGIKPLYYACFNDQLVFASELATLRLIPDRPDEIDADAVGQYLNLGFIPHPKTIYKGIHKLPPGHLLTFDASGPATPHRFHKLPDPHPEPPAYPEAATQLRTLIENAVTRQRVADVPLGAFLSGGIDSSIVVACLARVRSDPVKTFSIGYTDHHRYDETKHANCVARHFNTDHHAFHLGFKDIIDSVEPMLRHLGEPFADSSLLPTALVSRQTRQHVTVALSGDGGDELFGGYWRYLGHQYLERYRRIPEPLRRTIIEPLINRLPSARSNRLLDRLRQARKLLRQAADQPLDRHLAWSRIIDDQLTGELLGTDHARSVTQQLTRLYQQAAAIPHHADCPEHHASLNRILLTDLALGLPDDMLHKVDTASMYHGLEVRVPLLSADVVQFAAGLPEHYKISGSTTKRILRDAFRDRIPPSILKRRKMGFEVPVGEFLRHELHDMFHDLVTPATLNRFHLNPTAATRLYDDHLHRRNDHSEILWSLLVLCAWKP